MNNIFQNFQKLNKRISTPIAILVIVAVAIVCSALALWQYSEIQKETAIIPETQFSELKPATSPEDITQTSDTYRSPDGALHAQIIPVGKAQESMVRIFTNEDVLLQETDYSSEDGGHGLNITLAKWTPNSQFFIYSAGSSGGHQPWFSRVYFYNRIDNKIYSFTEESGFTVANDEFIVADPDIVTFTVFTSVGMGPKTVKSFGLNDVIRSSENLLKQ